MARRKRAIRGKAHAKKKPRGKEQVHKRHTRKQRAQAEQKKRSVAARKAVVTRRLNAAKKKRSEAARKGWESRRRHAPSKLDALLRRPSRARRHKGKSESGAWIQRQVVHDILRYTATYLFDDTNDIQTNSPKRVGEIAARLMYRVRDDNPKGTVKKYASGILYKRSSDGKTWNPEIVERTLTARTRFDDAVEEARNKAEAFYSELTNPNRFIHAYKVKMVGLNAVGLLRASEVFDGFGPGELKKLPIEVQPHLRGEKLREHLEREAERESEPENEE